MRWAGRRFQHAVLGCQMLEDDNGVINIIHKYLCMGYYNDIIHNIMGYYNYNISIYDVWISIYDGILL